VAFVLTGAIVVTGTTNSTNFPTREPLQAQNAGDADVFIARIAVDTLPPADTIAPTTTIGVSGTTGANGWFRSSVAVALSATDNQDGSGVSYVEYSLNNGPFQRYSAPFSIEAQGTTVVRARATDEAGNTENPEVSTVVAIDSVPPVISVISPTSTDYLHSAVLQLSFGATDATSGIDGAVTARLDGTSVTSGATVQLLAMTLGSHTLETTASDRAGNNGHEDRELPRDRDTRESHCGRVNTFAAQGTIASNTALSLISKLEDARRALNRGNVTAARSKLNEFSDQVTRSKENRSPRAQRRSCSMTPRLCALASEVHDGVRHHSACSSPAISSAMMAVWTAAPCSIGYGEFAVIARRQSPSSSSLHDVDAERIARTMASRTTK
jgi:hypothetical protein